MGAKWDGGGIAFDPATWAALSEHLLPGAFIFVFGSSRGWHRLAVAIEDAGFVFHPSLMVWGALQGQGFPKSTRIDTQIDRAAGAERKVIGHKHLTGLSPGRPNFGANDRSDGKGMGFRPGDIPIEQPATPLARAWEGHRYGRQALKPAVEMIICAQKPYEGRPVDSIVETGAGSLWIDGARVKAGVDYVEAGWGPRYGASSMPQMGGHQTRPYIQDAIANGKPVKDSQPSPSGRWPPNFCLVHVPPHICATCDGDGCDECNGAGLAGGCRRVGTKRVKGSNQPGSPQVPTEFFGVGGSGTKPGYADSDGYEETAAWQCVKSCAARRIGEQSGISSGRLRTLHHKSASGFVDDGTRYETMTHGDSGTAARFFPQFGWAAEIAERLANADQVRYCAKSSRSERDAGLSEVRQVQSVSLPKYKCARCGGWIRNESISAARRPNSTCNCEHPEPAEVCHNMQEIRNSHPCCKPIALCRWLATLLLPPPEYTPRRILVPFSGVSSEMISAVLAGWEFAHGIEMDEAYCEIGEARLSWWLRQLQLPGMEMI